MTDITTPTDAELCAMMAEVMGLPSRSHKPNRHGTHFYVSGLGERSFNPLISWEDFGRVWEWGLDRHRSLMMSAFQWKGSGRDNPNDGLGRIGGAEVEQKHDDGRRALVLAILRAEGRIE